MADISWQLALKQLMEADSPDAMGLIVARHEQELLSPSSLLSIERAVESARREGKSVLGPMEVVRGFLLMARERGIPAAVAQQTHRREAITHASAAYLAASVWDTVGVLRQYQRTLLDPDAIRMTRRVAAMASDDGSSDPLAAIRRAISTLKLALLDDAQAHGLDVAEQRYVVAMSDLIARSSSLDSDDD